MHGIVSGGVLVTAFAAVAALALLVVVRLYLISRPGPSPVRPEEPPDA
jgi:hypothetical protein